MRSVRNLMPALDAPEPASPRRRERGGSSSSAAEFHTMEKRSSFRASAKQFFRAPSFTRSSSQIDSSYVEAPEQQNPKRQPSHANKALSPTSPSVANSQYHLMEEDVGEGANAEYQVSSSIDQETIQQSLTRVVEHDSDFAELFLRR